MPDEFLPCLNKDDDDDNDDDDHDDDDHDDDDHDGLTPSPRPLDIVVHCE